MTDDSLMPWGKYKGEKMANVPSKYLLWLYDQGDLRDQQVKNYIENNIEVLRNDAKPENQ